MTKKGKICRSLSGGFQLRIVKRRRFGLRSVSKIAQKMVIWGDTTDCEASETFLTLHKTYRIYISTIDSPIFILFVFIAFIHISAA